MIDYYDLGINIILSFHGRSIKSIVEDYLSDDFLDALEEVSLKDLSINKEDIKFPKIINEFIMSIILWCNFPLSHEVSLTSEINIEDSQYNEAIKDYMCLSEAIIQDAFCIHRYVNLKEGGERGNIDNETKKYFNNSILYKSSLLYPVDYISSEREGDINHIDNFESFYKKEGYYLVYPAAFIVWLNCYDPNNPSKSIYEPRYKLLLTLLLPKRTTREYTKESDFDFRLFERIFKKILEKKQNKRLLSGYEDNIFSYNDNNKKSYDKIVKKYLKKDYIMSKFIQDNFGFSEEEFEFWNDLKNYAIKRKKNKRYHITYGNIIAIKNIFDKIDKDKNYSSSPSKTLSLIYLNNYTKWIDLLLLEKKLQLEATDIYGLRTKWLLCSIYNKEINDINSDIFIYYSQSNLIEYKDNSYLASIRVEENNYFLPSIVDGINIILKLLRLFFDDLSDAKKNKLNYRYKNAYNDLFDDLINETFLKEVSKTSIVRLAEYEYYKNN